MAKEEVKLFGAWGSPFVRRVQVALQMKGIQYEYIEEDLSNKSPLLLKYNPVHKKVPVLLHNGKPIAESAVILEYIDETWKGTPILPRDPYEKAMARFWVKYLEDKCLPALWKTCWSRGQEQEEAMKESYGVLKTLEDELKDKKFFGGETIGMVDLVANFVALWLGVLEEIMGIEVLTVEKFPILCRWVDDYVNCSIIKENLPPRDKLLAYFTARVQAATASA